jgi:PAS domain S-box-containing protein
VGSQERAVNIRPEGDAGSVGPDLAQLLEGFFEHALDAMVLGRPDGRLVRANPAACALLGRSEAEVLALDFRDLVVPSAALDRMLRELEAVGQTRGELTVVRADGGTFPAEVVASTIHAEGNERYGAVIFRSLSERKLAEAALRDATHRATSVEQGLAALARQSRDVIWSLDLASARFTYISPGILALRGFTVEEALAEPVERALTPESLRRVEALLAQIGTPAEKDPHFGLYQQPCKDGSVKDVEITTTYLRDAAGRPTTVMGISRDVTARVAAERALQQSEALYRQLFTLAPMGVVLVDLQGRLLASNDRAAEQLGYTREEYARLHIWDIDAEDDQARVQARIELVLREGYAEFQTLHRTRSGELRDVHVRTVPTDAGGVPALLATFDDVTASRRLERELRERLAERDEQERWLQASQRVARLGHYVFHFLEDRWTSSPVLDDLFGIGPGYPRTAGSWLELVHPEDRPVLRQYLDGLRVAGGRFDREYRLVERPGERVRWVHGLGDLERGPEGQAVRLVGTIQDVSARRQAEQAREVLAEQLLQAQKLESLGRLAGGVAHDFNNLLVVVLTCAENLQASLEAGRPAEAEDAREILAAGLRARELTSQLLAFARKQVVAPAPLDLGEVVARAEGLLRRLLREDVELVLQLGARLWPVLGDSGQLQQVLLNLAVNARDAMPRGGRLTISTANLERAAPSDGGWQGASPPPGPLVRLLVEDTGEGIPPEAWPRVFEPFFTTKPTGRGTGLGLATVYGIVQQAGASIRFRSAQGRGTAFEVCWPRAAGVPGPLETPEPRRVSAASPHQHVLLVEDDALVRAATTRALRHAGYQVTPTSGGAEALAALAAAATPPELLLTDVVMPGLNGRQVAEAVRAACPRIRVLFMSGYTQDLMARDAALEPGLDLLDKPFTTPVLLERVRQALARS